MQPSHSVDSEGFSVGDRVGFRILNVFGTVKFFGATEFAAGNWVGLDLDLPVGTSDGEVRGKRYFACGPGRGVFARPAALKRVDGDIRSSFSVVDLSNSFGSLETRSVIAAPKPPVDDGIEPPDPPPAPQERCAPSCRPGGSIKIIRSANKATPTVEVSESTAPAKPPAERVVKVVEVIKEVPVEKIVEVERVREVIKEVEVVKTVPVEKIVEVEKEVIKFVPVEKIVEVPKEVFRPLPAQKEIQEVVKEVEVIKEVPVEKIVEIEKEVVREVPVEKVVERVVEVEKEVEVVREVPVEKIVEVEKEVIREVPVEKIVEVEVVREVEKEVVKEVPVEKIVEVEVIREVIKEVPVETIVEKVVEVEREATTEAKPQTPSDLITQALSEIMEDLREEVQAQYVREKLAKNQEVGGTQSGPRACPRLRPRGQSAPPTGLSRPWARSLTSRLPRRSWRNWRPFEVHFSVEFNI